MKFKVTEKAMRPASDKKRCFYCKENIGDVHKDDCVLIRKKVKLKMVFEFEDKVPSYWDDHLVDFHYNDSSWCANNITDIIDNISEKDGCICNHVNFNMISMSEDRFINEN